MAASGQTYLRLRKFLYNVVVSNEVKSTKVTQSQASKEES